MEEKFAVVIFPEEKTCEAIPATWLTSDKQSCWFPPKNQRTKSKFSKCSNPLQSWKLYKCKILGLFPTYETAKQGAEIAEYTSSLEQKNSPKTKSRKRKRCQRNTPRSSSESDDVDSEDSSRGILNQPIARPIPSIPFLTAADEVSVPTLVSVDSNTITVKSSHASTSDTALAGSHGNYPTQLNYQEYSPSPSTTNFDVPADNSADLLRTPTSTFTFQIPSSGTSANQNVLDQAESSVNFYTVGNSTPTSGQNITERRFRELVLKRLAHIEATQNDILTTLNSFMVSTTNGGPGLVDFSEIPTHPATTIDELRNLNVFAESPSKSTLVSYLGLVGGKDLDSNVRSILRKLLKPELSQSISFGKRGKKQYTFVQFQSLLTCIKDAVRLHEATRTATDNKINHLVMDFFRFSRPPKASLEGS